MRRGKTESDPGRGNSSDFKAFSKFCLKRDWISKDITDAELDRIYAACDSLGGPRHPAQVTGPGAVKT
jgi:hypothetical protein